MTNHQDIVARVRDESPADTFTSTATMLQFVLRVLAALPPSERYGLVKAPPGGENVAVYEGTPVRVNRVIAPDGQIVKILTDSGPGGGNGPAWNMDDVRPDLYVPVTVTPTPVPVPSPTPVPTPVPTPPAPVDLGPVLAALDALRTDGLALRAEIAQVREAALKTERDVQLKLNTILARQDRAYVGAVGMRLRLTPEAKA